MKGRKTFTFTRTLVNGLFFIAAVATVAVFMMMTYNRLIRQEGKTALPAAVLHVSMGSTEPTPLDLAYYLRNDVVSVQRVDRFDVYASAHTALSYYCYMVNVLLLAAFFYGAVTLRRIFNTAFPGRNAQRLGVIGWLFIGTDVLKLAGYYLYTAIAQHYPALAGTQLESGGGKGLLAGMVMLAVSVAWKQGLEQHSARPAA
ncbi:hypothetical protein [Chitinophaga alhagiae]|uniref:hypothetical protein n=1 Tax=Chitinophaga alhagiae TaxID=2203219 RepID=UPI000E5A525E|nr:hypothetical protein [Chitinophaga alhagiae]